MLLICRRDHRFRERQARHFRSVAALSAKQFRFEDFQMSVRLFFLAIAMGLVAPTIGYAGISEHTNTSEPVVVVPQTTPAPQTPAYPAPNPGLTGPIVPQFAPRHVRAPAPQVPGQR